MSESNVEREVKLEVVDGFEYPDLTAVIEGAVVGALPTQSLETTYYDTRDLRLARAKMSLRSRLGEGAAKGTARWTLKLPEGTDGPALQRREVVVEGTAEQVPEELAGLVRATIRRAALAPVATLRTQRSRHEVSVDGTAVLEIDDDDVAVVEDGRVAHGFREVELELAAGADGGTLERAARAFVRAGAAPGTSDSKLARALGADAVGRPEVAPVAVDRKSSMGTVAQAAIADGVLRLLRHDPGVRIGGDDEDVHQMRVATRRLRSDLRTFASVLDTQVVDAVRAELSWLGTTLGRVRDADVLYERLRGHAAVLPAGDARGAKTLLGRLETERGAARRELLDALATDRYVDLVETLVAYARRPPLTAGSEDAAADRLDAFVHRQWRKLRDAVRALPHDPQDEDLHAVRIRAKRVRYAAEAAEAVCGKPARRLARALAALQGVLGDLQDAVVAEDWLRAAGAKGPGPAAFAAGELAVRERAERATLRTAWPAAWDEVLRAAKRW